MTPRSILALCSFVALAFAQSDGMNMPMDGPMNLAVGNMLSYAHFTPGDTLWFLGWVPRSAGSMVGACIGVFLLSLLERWLVACLDLAERHWVERVNIMVLEKSVNVSLPSSSTSSSSLPSTGKSEWRQIPPFVPEFDITRGVLFAAHAFIKIFLMLAVMTFQLGFLLSIVVGSGVGETLFGRFSGSLSFHEH